MVEDFASREWAANHQQFSNAIAQSLRTLWCGFKHLNAAQYDAPWDRKPLACKLAR